MKRVFAIILSLICITSTVFLGACSNNSSAPQTSAVDTGTQATSAGVPSSPSGDDTVYTFRIGSGSGGANPLNYFMDNFKEYVEAESGGRIEVEVYPNGQLGTLTQMVQDVANGSVSAYLMPQNYWAAIVPEYEILDVPLLFDNAAHMARTFMRNKTTLDDRLRDVGIESLTFIMISDMYIATQHDVTSLRDLAGLKAWTNPGPINQSIVTTLGMVPSLIDFGEVTSALQNGTIDAVVGGTTALYPLNIHEVADYLIMSHILNICGPVMVSIKYMETLPEDLQTLIREAAVKVNEEMVYEYSIGFQDMCLEELKKGMTLRDPTETLATEVDEALSKVRGEFFDNHPEYTDIYNEIQALADQYR